MILGDKIKKLRKEKGLSQAQLASMIGRAQNTISGIENGGGTDNETIKLLAEALQTKISYLVDNDLDIIDDKEIKHTKEYEFAFDLVTSVLDGLNNPEELTKEKMEYIEAILKKAIENKGKEK